MTEASHLSDKWTSLRRALLDVVGEKGCLFDPQNVAAYCEDWRRLYKGQTRLSCGPPVRTRWRRLFACVAKGMSRSCLREATRG